VLSAGALETPKLLLLSGVGPGEVLRRRGLPSLAEVPEVGQNLHDHPNVQLFFRGAREVDCNYPQLYGFHRVGRSGRLPEGQADTCYVFYPARSSFREGMLKLLPAIALPEPLYTETALPELMRSAIASAFERGVVSRFVKRMWGIVVILGKPKSRGSVEVESRDPSRPARIDPAYFADPEDMETMIDGVALARRMASARAMEPWGQSELMPGPMGRSDKALASFIRKNVMTTYHYAGTCRMGEDARAVVDTRLRLRGLENVRIADASVMPTAPVSALNAPSMMIGLRAAKMIREERR
jgi:choline dehydrogenase